MSPDLEYTESSTIVPLVQDKDLTEASAPLKGTSLYATIKERLSGVIKTRRELPAYDPQIHGPLVEMEIPVGYTEIERYWVNEPFSFICILEKGNIFNYHVAEPELTLYERDVLERVYDDLRDILSLGALGREKIRISSLQSMHFLFLAGTMQTLELHPCTGYSITSNVISLGTTGSTHSCLTPILRTYPVMG